MAPAAQNWSTNLDRIKDAQYNVGERVLAQGFRMADGRSAKVLALRHSITSGTYRVSSLDMASKLLMLMLR